MNSEKLRIVFFIENIIEEKILRQNDFLRIFKNNIVAFPEYLKIKDISENQLMPVINSNFYDALPEILEKAGSEWILYLKSGEMIKNELRTDNLRELSYNVQIETILSRYIKTNNLLHAEQRLFNRNFDYKLADMVIDLKLSDFSSSFPELENYKVEQYLNNYYNGKRDFETVIFLAQRMLIKFNPRDLVKTYLQSNSSLKDYEALELYRFLGNYFLNSNDLLNAETVLAQGLKYFQNSACLNFSMAKLFFIRGEYEKSLKGLEYCLKLLKNVELYKFLAFPLSIVGYLNYFYQAKAYMAMGDYQKAKVALENSLASEPDFLPAADALKKTNTLLKSHNLYFEEDDFVCQGCGNSCRSFYVEITNFDIKRILDNRHDLKAEDFAEYKIKEDVKGEKRAKLFLKHQENSLECIFLKNNRCMVHEYKPTVCKIWPFNLRKNKLSWADNHREFIKNKCAHKIIKGQTNKVELKESILEYEKEVQLNELFLRNWQNRSSEEVLNYISNNNFRIIDKMEKFMEKVVLLLQQINNFKLIVKKSLITFDDQDSDNSIDLTIFTERYLSEEKISEFADIIAKEFGALYYLIHPYLHSQNACIFYINGIELKLFFENISEYQSLISEKTEVLYNPDNLEITFIPEESAIKNIINGCHQKYLQLNRDCLYYFDKHDFKGSDKFLNEFIENQFFKLLYFLNKIPFSLFNINYLKYKTDDLKYFCEIYKKFKLDYISQQEKLRICTDIFKKHYQMLKI